MSKVEERLASVGAVVPDVPLPLAAYVPGLVSGNLVYTSGQLPMANGQLAFKGAWARMPRLRMATRPPDSVPAIA